MAGYSGTPLPKKLGIKEGHALCLLGAPDGFAETLGELPPGVHEEALAGAPLDVIVFFTKEARELEAQFARLKAALDFAGGLWIARPKKASGVKTDVHDGFVREYGLSQGLVDNKVCAIDETWSGLRFVYRREDRPKAR